jgi:Xaa-Pro aminopeptidase
MRPGVKGGDLYAVAREKASEQGIGDYLLKLNDRYSKFIGHGIGLEVNEPPVISANSKQELQSGMVVTVEIHLSHPQHGAMKIEQMVLITNRGCEILSQAGNELYVIDC